MSDFKRQRRADTIAKILILTFNDDEEKAIEKVLSVLSDEIGLEAVQPVTSSVLSFSEANALIENLDRATVSEDGYYKTKFRIDFVMDGQPDYYVGRQDLGDGDGTLIEHIESYHAYYENNEQWDKP